MKINIDNLAVLDIDSDDKVANFLKKVYSYYQKNDVKNTLYLPSLRIVPMPQSSVMDISSMITDVHGKKASVSLDLDDKKASIYYEEGYIPDSLLFNVIEPVMILLNVLLVPNTVPFHASSFSINNQGVLVAARSGLGKSTLLLEAVLHANGKFIADEIGWVRASKLVPYLRGLYIYRRNYYKFDELYLITSGLVKLEHKLLDLMLFAGDLVKPIGLESVSNFLHKRLMLPILFHPTELGEICSQVCALSNIIIIRDSSNETTQPSEFLLDYVSDLWRERDFFRTDLATNFKKDFMGKAQKNIDSLLKSVHIHTVSNIESYSLNELMVSPELKNDASGTYF